MDIATWSHISAYSVGLQAGGFPINETKNHCRELGNVYTKWAWYEHCMYTIYESFSWYFRIMYSKKGGNY